MAKAALCAVLATLAACGPNSEAGGASGGGLSVGVYQTRELTNGIPDGIVEFKRGAIVTARAPHLLGEETIDLTYRVASGTVELIESADTTVVDSGQLQPGGCIDFEGMGLVCRK